MGYYDLLLGIHPEKTIIAKDTCTPMTIAALFTRAKTWKQHKWSMTDELNKERQYIEKWNMTRP